MTTRMILTSTFTSEDVPTPMEFSPIVSRKTVQKRSRSVSFFPKVYIQGTLHRKDYTETEKRETWLTPSELKVMKRSCLKLGLEFSKRNLQPRDNDETDDFIGGDCFRGLEGRTRKGLVRRKTAKKVARTAVFREQRHQKQWGVTDAHKLADAYYECTEYPRMEAHMMGLRDETETAGVRLALEEEASSTIPLSLSLLCPLPLSLPLSCPVRVLGPSPDDVVSTLASTASIASARSNNNIRRKAMLVRSCARGDSTSTRSIQSLTSLLSTRRLLTDAFFKV